VVDVRVQGAAASRRIVYGLRQMASRDLDVVVLVRGGGSRADLAPFDTDTVARVIATMPMPVITGVGHEVDRSVADEVAHTSCKTPTACAQILVARVHAFAGRLDSASQRVAGRARTRTGLARRELAEAARRVQRGVPAALARERAQVERHHGRVEELARLRVRDAARQLDDCSRRVGELGRSQLRHTLHQLDAKEAMVRALDPRRVLERGYSITRDEHGRSIRRVGDASPGAVLHTELVDGALVSTVDHVVDGAGAGEAS
jgi:exodeoxyribonuclease VII large subunit